MQPGPGAYTTQASSARVKLQSGESDKICKLMIGDAIRQQERGKQMK